MNPPNLTDTFRAVTIARQALAEVEIPDDLLWNPVYLAVARAKRHLTSAGEQQGDLLTSQPHAANGHIPRPEYQPPKATGPMTLPEGIAAIKHAQQVLARIDIPPDTVYTPPTHVTCQQLYEMEMSLERLQSAREVALKSRLDSVRERAQKGETNDSKRTG